MGHVMNKDYTELTTTVVIIDYAFLFLKRRVSRSEFRSTGDSISSMAVLHACSFVFVVSLNIFFMDLYFFRFRFRSSKVFLVCFLFSLIKSFTWLHLSILQLTARIPDFQTQVFFSQI